MTRRRRAAEAPGALARVRALRLWKWATARLAALAAVALVATSAPLIAVTPAAAQVPEVVCLSGLRFAYVANSGDTTVSVIDTSSDDPNCPPKVKTIDLKTVDAGGALEEAGKAVSGGGVSPEKVTVSPGVAPFGVVASPDRRRVYVTHGAGHFVSVIDTATNKVEDTITVGPLPAVVLTGAAVSPDSAHLYVVATTGVEIDAPGPGLLYPIEIAKIGTPEDPVGKPVEVGLSPTGVAVSRDGSEVYVTNTGSGTVSVVDIETFNEEGTVEVKVGEAPTAVAANPKRNEIYVVNTGGEKTDAVSAEREWCRPGTTDQDAAAAPSSISVIDTSSTPPSVKCTWVSEHPVQSWRVVSQTLPVNPLFQDTHVTFTGVAASPGGGSVYAAAATSPNNPIASTDDHLGDC